MYLNDEKLKKLYTQTPYKGKRANTLAGKIIGIQIYLLNIAILIAMIFFNSVITSSMVLNVVFGIYAIASIFTLQLMPKLAYEILKIGIKANNRNGNSRIVNLALKMAYYLKHDFDEIDLEQALQIAKIKGVNKE